MGTTIVETTNYNKLEDPENPIKGDCYGPFIAPSVSNFTQDIENKYLNRTLISTALENLQSENFPFLGRRLFSGIKDNKETFEEKFTYFSSKEVYDMIISVAKNIHENEEIFVAKDNYMNINFKIIGIFAKNCTEWVLTDFACQADSITTATLYSTLGEEAFNYICDLTKIKTICVSPDLVDSLVSYKKKFGLECLKNVIVFDMTTYCNDFQGLYEKLKKVGFNVYSFKDFLVKVNPKEIQLEISKPETIMTICFTSGTTGKPKGVMLSQGNLISLLECAIKDSSIPLRHDSVHFSYLPLAHIFERMMIGAMMVIKSKTGFITGKVKDTMMDDLRSLKPTLFCTVPKVLQTIKKKIFEVG